MVSILGPFIPAAQTAGLERYLGDGEDGPTYGLAVQESVRWEPSTREMQLRDGRVVTMRAKVHMAGPSDPKPGDRLTYQGDTYKVAQVDTPVWIDGTPMHHEVWAT